MPIPALSEQALTTYDVACAAAGLSPGAEDKATKFAQLIEAVSEAAASIVGRVLHYEQDIVSRVVGEDTVRLWLPRRPALFVSLVELIGRDGVADELDATSYELYEDRAQLFNLDGVWCADQSAPMGIGQETLPTGRRNYRVTYDAGWVTPEQAAQAPRQVATTAVVVASNVATATVAEGHNIRPGDAIYTTLLTSNIAAGSEVDVLSVEDDSVSYPLVTGDGALADGVGLLHRVLTRSLPTDIETTILESIHTLLARSGNNVLLQAETFPGGTTLSYRTLSDLLLPESVRVLQRYREAY